MTVVIIRVHSAIGSEGKEREDEKGRGIYRGFLRGAFRFFFVS
jgi:hypothetical protein